MEGSNGVIFVFSTALSRLHSLYLVLAEERTAQVGRNKHLVDKMPQDVSVQGVYKGNKRLAV